MNSPMFVIVFNRQADSRAIGPALAVQQDAGKILKFIGENPEMRVVRVFSVDAIGSVRHYRVEFNGQLVLTEISGPAQVKQPNLDVATADELIEQLIQMQAVEALTFGHKNTVVVSNHYKDHPTNPNTKTFHGPGIVLVHQYRDGFGAPEPTYLPPKTISSFDPDEVGPNPRPQYPTHKPTQTSRSIDVKVGEPHPGISMHDRPI